LYELGPGDGLILPNRYVFGWMTENNESENLDSENLPPFGLKSKSLCDPGPGESL
jgi:hypothetical protein